MSANDLKVKNQPIKSEPTSELETVEMSEDECSDRAMDLSVDEPDESKRKVFAVRELAPLAGRYCDEISVEGIFSKGFRVKTVKGTQSFNLHESYRILNIELTDSVDSSKRIKVSIWGSAVDLFKSQKPKINDHLVFHNLSMSVLDQELATKFGVLPLSVNCNAASSNDFGKLLNLDIKRIKFIQLSSITEQNDQEVVNLKASVVSVRDVRENLRKVLVKQASGKSIEIDFWKDKTTGWHSELEHLSSGIFCAFYGVYLKAVGGSIHLVASDFTRILKIKVKKR